MWNVILFPLININAFFTILIIPTYLSSFPPSHSNMIMFLNHVSNSGKFLAWQRAALERLTFPIQNKKPEPVCSITTLETPVRTTLQCLYNLRRHKIPITKAKTKLPARKPCLMVVSQYATSVDQLIDPNSFSTRMMNASTSLQWLITYEITRHRHWWSSFPAVLLVSYFLVYFLHLIQLGHPPLFFQSNPAPVSTLFTLLSTDINIYTTSQYLG